MRYRLDEKRLPQTTLSPPSRSLETDFEKLSGKIGEILEQLDAPIAASEEALAVVQRRLRTKPAPVP
jgi:hypothetical protein